MSGPVLVVIEHDRVRSPRRRARRSTAGRLLAGDRRCRGVVDRRDADARRATSAMLGADAVQQVHHDSSTTTPPRRGATRWSRRSALLQPAVVVATGTERGNEVLAHVAARLDEPFAANAGRRRRATRLRGDPAYAGAGRCSRTPRSRAGDILLPAIALRTSSDAEPTATGRVETRVFDPALVPTPGRTRRRDRVERAAGVTLTTAPVVVSGGRGVGSADGFARSRSSPSCSAGPSAAPGSSPTRAGAATPIRSARPASASPRPLHRVRDLRRHPALGRCRRPSTSSPSTPTATPMVTKADYAVIGDLHEVVPAIARELRKP